LLKLKLQQLLLVLKLELQQFFFCWSSSFSNYY